MFTSGIWWDFEFKVKLSCYRERELAWLLLGTILGTPFTIILDILTLPIQLIYKIALKKIRKLRNK